MPKLGEAESPIGAAEGDDAVLIDNPDVPTVYAHGVYDIEIHPPCVRVTYYQYRNVGPTRVRTPVLVMIRTLIGWEEGSTIFQQRFDEFVGQERGQPH